MTLEKNLSENLAKLKKELSSSDVEFLEIFISDKKALLIYVSDIVNKEAIGQLILRPATEYKGEVSQKAVSEIFLSPEKNLTSDLKQVINEIVSGSAVLLVDGLSTAFIFGLKKFEKRAITEPPTSTVIKGPREGFVESLPVNVSMIRRRLKTPDLTFEHFSVGQYSNTTVALCYVKGIADKGLINKLRKKKKRKLN